MTGGFNFEEAEAVLQNRSIIDESIQIIYDDALASNDIKTLGRILDTYPRDHLEFVLGEYPDFLDEERGI